MDWPAYAAGVAERRRRLLADGPGEGERADLHAAAVASCSWALGLAALMDGRPEEAGPLFLRAADEYDASGAPAGSWGRPLASLRCALLAGDGDAARARAADVLAAGAETAESPIARYAAALALLVQGLDERAGAVASSLREEAFPADVAAALAALAARDRDAYAAALGTVLRSFEERDAFLEDAPVADTVLVLQALAAPRGIAARLHSPLLPAGGGGETASGM